MKHIAISALICLALFPIGCRIGPTPQTFLKATGPINELTLQPGIRIKELGRRFNRRVGHELLEINDQGLLIIAKGKIIQVQYRALQTYKYKQKPLVFMKKHTPSHIKGKIVELDDGILRLLSRFPQGVSPTVLEALLRAHEQDQLILISRD